MTPLHDGSVNGLKSMIGGCLLTCSRGEQIDDGGEEATISVLYLTYSMWLLGLIIPGQIWVTRISHVGDQEFRFWQSQSNDL